MAGLATLGLLLGGTLLAGSTALAVNATGAFELDGNANNQAAAGDDWDNVCYQVAINDGKTAVEAQALCGTSAGTTATATVKSTAVSWVAETDPSATIFTGGGSKDPQDPGDSWAWKNAGGLPDKDNLLHGFAARYSVEPNATTCPAGTFPSCEVIFFGSDRYANDGDAVQGFWFFQNKIELGDVSRGGGFAFTGHHKNGDLLVISDFSNGGDVSTIVVHQWDDTCLAAANNNPQPGQCSAENLRLRASSAAANCATSASTAQFCGIVNPNTITMPWPFLDKKGTPDNGALNGEFFEGGINLSTLGLGGECFASVASETRSSTSPTATLKDFILDNFGECGATLSTQVSNAGPVIPGTAVYDTLTVTSTNPNVTPSGTVSWYLCAMTTATGACDGTTNVGSPIGTPPANQTTLGGSGGIATTQSPNVNTGTGLAPGRYCFRAEWPGDTNFTAGPYKEFGGANGTNECFTVKDTSSITTDQKWLPQDTATVVTAGGTAVSGTVVFSLYENGTCAGTPATTFTDTTVATGGKFETNNSTYYTTSKTISWSAVFTPTDTTAVVGSTTTRCEQSVLTIDNSAGPFPPA
ncbi:hypothetical protein [Humibacillus xanthopallidus]|uniref:Ig-like domain-containing protein n=1 Tax=Humibacillus xanthopallidus TaxID=412689 RepID=A0A543HWM2_9MICO|nr:hypothetical protein [Humibacillus xanthopallidus]TQM62690.1 hypothetical protein FBY41_2728 [Humibacillus xanthopallidus]